MFRNGGQKVREEGGLTTFCETCFWSRPRRARWRNQFNVFLLRSIPVQSLRQHSQRGLMSVADKFCGGEKLGVGEGGGKRVAIDVGSRKLRGQRGRKEEEETFPLFLDFWPRMIKHGGAAVRLNLQPAGTKEARTREEDFDWLREIIVRTSDWGYRLLWLVSATNAQSKLLRSRRISPLLQSFGRLSLLCTPPSTSSSPPYFVLCNYLVFVCSPPYRLYERLASKVFSYRSGQMFFATAN